MVMATRWAGIVGERVSDVARNRTTAPWLQSMRKVVLMYGDLKFDNRRTEKRSVETRISLMGSFRSEGATR